MNDTDLDPAKRLTPSFDSPSQPEPATNHHRRTPPVEWAQTAHGPSALFSFRWNRLSPPVCRCGGLTHLGAALRSVGTLSPLCFRCQSGFGCKIDIAEPNLGHS